MAERTKLHTIRKARGLSQGRLSIATQIPKRTIEHYEQRTRDIDGAHIGTLVDMCIALDCRLTDILENEELISKFQKLKGAGL